MHFSAQQLSYRDTAAFSKIVLDYIEGTQELRPFYAHAPSYAGIEQAIALKQQQSLDRETLVTVLREQYATVEPSPEVTANVEALLRTDTFTICTAHQPNLFSGPLYFIYKILHTVRIAADLKKAYPAFHFVPVYYMGSEDADKEELLHTYVNGKKYEWQTVQTGAVGRMHVDAGLIKLIDEIGAQINIEPSGTAFTQLFQGCYTKGKTIQSATFELVHALFKKFGVIVLIADHGDLKKLMLPVFEQDLFQQTPSEIVEQTCIRLGKHYNVQAQPREINLFYLADGIRNRIVKVNDSFIVHDTDIQFTEAAMKTELQNHPERFSPNVILRGLFQETILPNVAFVGGGGELAYWLQLKDLFQHYTVPYPVLVLRNSFLILEKKWQQRLEKWKLPLEKLFSPELQIFNMLLAQEGKLPQLNGEVIKLATLYEGLKKVAISVDATLEQHVNALQSRSLQQLQNLEKKMARAERKKHASLQHQIQQLKDALFPTNGLQERVENISSFYAKWGSSLIDELLQHSLSLEQQFTVLVEG